MLENFLEQRRWLIPLILLAGCVLFFSSLFFLNAGGGIFWGFDMREYTYPYFDFISREMRDHGSLPLWNPHQFIGFSLVGGGQQGLFYPPHWLVLVMDARDMITVNLVLHVYLGALGIAMLTRQLGASRVGGIFAGLMWAGSGSIAGRVWAGHYTLLLPMGWMPWVFVGYLWAAQRGTWRAGMLPGIALALMLISGHPQITLIASVTTTLLWAFEAFRPTPPAETASVVFWQATRPMITLVITAVLLSAVASLPVLATIAESDRANSVDRLEFADRFSLPANQLFTFIFPTLAGIGRETWADPNFEELFAYSGLLVLIGLPILLQRARRQVWLLVLLTSIGILMGMALDGGLLRLLIQVIPPFGIFRSNGRWLMIAGMGLACLTGLFITQLQRDQPEERALYLKPITQRWLPRLVIGLFGISFLMSLARLVDEAVLDHQAWWHAAEVVAGAALLLLLINLALFAVQQSTSQRALMLLLVIALLDVWRITMPLLNVSNSNPYAPIWRRIERVIPQADAVPARIVLDQRDYRSFNAATAYGYYDIYGYEALPSETYQRWLDLSNDPLAFTNRLLGVRYFVKSELLPESEAANATLLYERPASKVYIYEANYPLDRAFLATHLIEVPETTDPGNQYLRYNQTADPAVVLVNQMPACATEGAVGEVEITEYRANMVRLQVNSETGGLVILTDRYAPGWKAEVNGDETPIHRANTIFRAVCVPPGTSEVVFSYLPGSLVAGGVISLLAWIGVGGVLVLDWRRR